VTGNHSTSTGPISIAAIRTQVLVFSTSVPRNMQLGFPNNSQELNAQVYIYIYINVDCSVDKVVGYVRGLPSLAGLGAGVSKLSELWFGASVRFPKMFPGSSEISTSGSGISS
jgi:hypothetical protein